MEGKIIMRKEENTEGKNIMRKEGNMEGNMEGKGEQKKSTMKSRESMERKVDMQKVTKASALLCTTMKAKMKLICLSIPECVALSSSSSP